MVRVARPRRMAVDGDRQRELIVDAAERLLKEEGYAAISARQVMSAAGLKAQLLYYYFKTMDDLMLAVVQRVNERRFERFQKVLVSSNPLQAIWELSSDPTGALLSAELISLAGHHESIRQHIIESAKAFRKLQTETLSRLLEGTGIDKSIYPAAGIVLIASAVARIIGSEQSLGLTDGHKQAQAIIQHLIEQAGAEKRKKRR